MKEIADAIRRDAPDTSDEVAYRMAWETYCSYTNPSHPGCTEKGKSQRESPKPYEKAAQTKTTDWSKLDEALHHSNPNAAAAMEKEVVDKLKERFTGYWNTARQAESNPAAIEDFEAVYANFLGTEKGLEGTDIELALRRAVEPLAEANPMEMQEGEDPTDWFQRVMSGNRLKVKMADVSELLEDSGLQKKIKKNLERTMKKDKGPDSLDEAYDELDDQVEEEMDDIVPPGKPDKTGDGSCM